MAFREVKCYHWSSRNASFSCGSKPLLQQPTSFLALFGPQSIAAPVLARLVGQSLSPDKDHQTSSLSEARHISRPSPGFRALI
ncbi:hypothetical protein FOVSG1_002783 [Fusarium oxysporum f. sp. vasinfectum]